MHVIRNFQLAQMRRAVVDASIQELILAHPGSGLTQQEVSAAAARFGISAQPDLRELVRLLADVGIDALSDPAGQWIVDTLGDPDSGSPSARLARVRDLSARRAALAARNAEAERLFAAAGPQDPRSIA
jgi:hypothetical protein